MSGAAVRRALTRNTVLVVASCPGFPHGVMDHVEDIAQVGCMDGWHSPPSAVCACQPYKVSIWCLRGAACLHAFV